jgi:ATP-dependent RNA helicase DeaD
VSLSGELSQSERTHALQAMRDGRARVCVATDVAARGIDLPNLDLVIHAELPTNAETLLHRSGRTGRAGRKGLSALVVPPKAVKRAERLLKSARVVADWTSAPGADEIRRRDEERLLAHPAWSDELSEDEAAFADQLLGLHSPRAIAAACLRFYRAQHSAPEELTDPATPSPAAERRPFGPSVWFSLSVGRDDRAEPRWLLPVLCRAGRIGKESIGAIRIQKSETFVELAEASVPGFLAALGEEAVLEGGIRVSRLDSVPDMGRRSSQGAPARQRSAAEQKAPAEARPPQPEPQDDVGPVAVQDLPGRPSVERDEAAETRRQPPTRDKAPNERAPRRPDHASGEREPWKRREKPGGYKRGPSTASAGRSEEATPARREDAPSVGARKPRHGKPGKPFAKSGPGQGGSRPQDGRKPGPKGPASAQGSGGKPPAKRASFGDERPKRRAPAPDRASASDTSRRYDPSGRPPSRAKDGKPGKPGGRSGGFGGGRGKGGTSPTKPRKG